MRDPARARAMGESARRHALARFSIDRMTDAYEGLYRGPERDAQQRAAAAEL
jgi:hypothetical protein